MTSRPSDVLTTHFGCLAKLHHFVCFVGCTYWFYFLTNIYRTMVIMLHNDTDFGFLCLSPCNLCWSNFWYISSSQMAVSNLKWYILLATSTESSIFNCKLLNKSSELIPLISLKQTCVNLVQTKLETKHSHNKITLKWLKGQLKLNSYWNYSYLDGEFELIVKFTN